MLYFVIFLLLLFFVTRVLLLLLKKYSNPYKLYMVFGKKGSGKTTLLTKLALRHLKEGRKVYSTVKIPGVYYFDVNYLGQMVFPPESVVFIDEVGIIWDNRNFKSFKPEVRDFFKYQRQYRVMVYLFSQTFDVDLKLRNLTDAMFLCRSHGGILSTARRISRNIVLTQATGNEESRIADNLVFEPLVSMLWGGKPVIFTWIPSYSRYFNSFDPPDRELVPCELLPELQYISFIERHIFLPVLQVLEYFDGLVIFEDSFYYNRALFYLYGC